MLYISCYNAIHGLRLVIEAQPDGIDGIAFTASRLRSAECVISW